jgi:CheY-like chemotaxis protein
LLDLDTNTVRALEPWFERVLIVDPSAASARLLSDVLHTIAPGRLWTANTTRQAMHVIERETPQLIFVEFAGGEVDGAGFTRWLRRSGYSCRTAPVIMTTGRATPAVISAARDSGVHEFLRKPFTFKDLIKRLEAAVLYKRNWIEAVGYVGPDRRRFNSAGYAGRRKRKTDSVQSPEQERIVQALKIIAAALPMVEKDRLQAFRAIKTQAVELQRAGTIAGHPELVQAALALHRLLEKLQSPQALTVDAIEAEARTLLAFVEQPAPKPVAA